MAQRIVLTDHLSAPVRARWGITMAEVAEGLTLAAKAVTASAWGIQATYLRSHSGRVDGELVFVDTSDVAGALGYHELSPAGTPYGIVAVGTTMDSRNDPMVTADHEAKEMLGDTDASALAEIETSGGFRGVAYELCDPVEADSDGYPVKLKSGRTLQVSNFVLPAWFVPGGPGPYDYLGQLKAALTLRPGGYMAKFDPQHGWSQSFARLANGDMSFRASHTRRIPSRWVRHAHFEESVRGSLMGPVMIEDEVPADVPVL
jgi:hypothetical protein